MVASVTLLEDEVITVSPSMTISQPVSNISGSRQVNVAVVSEWWASLKSYPRPTNVFSGTTNTGLEVATVSPIDETTRNSW